MQRPLIAAAAHSRQSEPVDGDRVPALALLVGGYFHLYWLEEYGDPWAAVDAFAAQEPVAAQLPAEVDAILSAKPPIDPSDLRRSFDRLTRRAGLGHWHPHELRHSAASLMSAAGVPLERIADLLGHDGTRMTALVYRHAVTPTVRAAVVPMERMFGRK